MKLELTSVAGIIEPEGCPLAANVLFQVSAEYDARLQQASNAFIAATTERLDGPDLPHGLCDATLVRDFTRLIDEHAKPETPGELAFASYIMGRSIHHIRLYATSGKIQVRMHSEPSFPKGGVFQNTNATA